MGQYHKLINITKKEYIVGHDIGINLKHYEQIGFEEVVMYLVTKPLVVGPGIM